MRLIGLWMTIEKAWRFELTLNTYLFLVLMNMPVLAFGLSSGISGLWLNR